jgi:hypothetical protein
MRKLINYLVLAAAGALFAALMAATPAQAAVHHSDPAAQTAHFIACFKLLGTPEHAKECGPGHEFTGKFSNAWNSENYTPPATTTETPPCEHPPCKPECHPCPPPPCHPCPPPCVKEYSRVR